MPDRATESNAGVQLQTPDEIQDAYRGEATAVEYISKRFTGELTRLLHEKQVRAINRAFAEHRPATALELACGPGRLTRDVVPTGRLTCLEFNSGMLNVARKACSRDIEWLQGDAFHLPLTDCVDLAYTFRFIRHFRRQDRSRLYGQIHRALRPGGVLLMDAINERVSAPLRASHPEDYPIYDKLYADVNDLRRELAEEGFELLRAEPVQRWHAAQYQAQVLVGPRSRLLCRALIQILERLGMGPPLEWIVTARRA